MKDSCYSVEEMQALSLVQPLAEALLAWELGVSVEKRVIVIHSLKYCNCSHFKVFLASTIVS